MIQALADCTFSRWQPGIGDPTWQGWVTVLVYVLVAALAFRVAAKNPFPRLSRYRERQFWILIAVLMALLAINKQLDLQSAMTAAGRCLAQMQGWYGNRRPVQELFLIAIGALAVSLLLYLLWLLRGTWRRSAAPIVGLCFVIGFVLMRAVGFHHFDQALGVPVLSLRLNFVLELVGPLLIGISAIALMRRQGIALPA